jgi:beta-lactamase class A
MPKLSMEQPQPPPHPRSHTSDSVMCRPFVKLLCLFSLCLISSALAAPEPDRSLSHAHPLDRALTERIRAVAAAAVAQGVVRRVGVAVYDLATGRRAGLNTDQMFRPASVIKLAVMVAAFRERPHMPPGQFDRLGPDLERMITVSDNAATRRLVVRLGVRQVNTAVRELGIARFRVGESGSAKWVLQGSLASPADTALLLARIARREVVSRQACSEMLKLLGAQHKRRRIPAGLPSAPDLWVGNKTGTLVGVVNDAGIVLQPSRGVGYTLAIFTSGAHSEKAGDKLLADLSAMVYGYMEQHRKEQFRPTPIAIPKERRAIGPERSTPRHGHRGHLT